MNFNAAAQSWDTEKRIKRAKIIADEILKSIEVKKEYSALEFGCGTGLVSFNLRDNFYKITLVDNSQGMIDQLNMKIQDSNIQNMKAYHLDINDEHDKLSNYDVIYTSMALHHVKDIKGCLEILFKLLNTGGYICIVDLTEEDGSFHRLEKDFDGHNGFNTDRLSEVLKEVGFKNIYAHVFHNDTKDVGDAIVDYSLFIMTGKKNESVI